MLPKTKEEILQNMLLNISDDYDKQMGSFVWDVLSATSIEIENSLLDLERKHLQTYAEYATGEDLEMRTEEMGVSRLPATYSIGEVEFIGSVGTVIPAETLVSTTGGIQFQTNEPVTIDNSGKVIAEITAVNPGIAGNVTSSAIQDIPITISGVVSVNNTDPTYGGEDEETDELLRLRYFRSIKEQAMDGNIKQYEKWAEEYPGVGKVRVFPLWNGENTIKVSILDVNNTIATSKLIEDFQNYMDPNSTGLGNGVAPIGSIVTVSTASPIPLNLSATIILTEGYSEPIGVDDAITEYLSELAYSKNTVSYMSLGAVILSVPSIDQIQNLLINGSTADLILTPEQIPQFGTQTWTVKTS